MKQYTSLTCFSDIHTLQILSAVAGMLPISGIQDNDSSIVLFFDEGNYNSDIKSTLLSWTDNVEIQFLEEKVEERNWNSEFEKSLEPIRISDNLIITQTWNQDFKENENDYIIYIDPKMSFGTGHHESTRLISRLMLAMEFNDMKVLDVGTGTGILAILAILKNAKHVLAFDNNEWAVNNAKENFKINKVDSKVDNRLCEIKEILENDFDIVLMNIHRNLIIELIPEILKRVKLNEKFSILTSGVLIEDYDSLLETLKLYNLYPYKEAKENEWIATQFKISSIKN